MKKILFTILTLGFAFSLFNCHSWKHKSPEERAEYISKKVKSHLDLDESQIKVVDKIKAEWLAKHKELKFDPADKDEFLKLVKSEKLDEAKLDALDAKMTNRKTEMHKFFLVKFKEFHAILKPEQKEKLAKHMEKMMKRFGHGIE
ncbi:MAG: Spy/CpxP family protein refolding chaperone [Leptospiraceae bacterium]|nr:Spy/CpxP family protein refolding chaperone [Leptospiraceae bacterium]MCP5510399.1 Spy/CpxP family protein refolding chaperone [Leptospiraceae bacterium]